MNALLGGGLPQTDRNGVEIYPSFRNMIQLDAIISDEKLTESQKILLSLYQLYGEQVEELNLVEAWEELTWFRTGGEDSDTEEKKQAEPVFDFEEDAPYLCGAFLSAYGIDLTDSTCYLHWWTFRALFMALPEESTMSKRISYRSMDISKMKGETLEQWKKIKQSVALKKSKGKKMTLEEAQRAAKERIAKRYAEAKAQRLGKEEKSNGL